MKKTYLVALALLSTFTLASCDSEVTYIEELPYKEELSSQEKSGLFTKILKETENADYIETYSKEYKRERNGQTTNSSTVKAKCFLDEYIEIAMTGEETSKYEGYDGYSKLNMNIYMFYDNDSSYLYLSSNEKNSTTKTKVNKEQFNSQLPIYDVALSMETYTSLFTVYKNGDGYAFVYEKEEESKPNVGTTKYGDLVTNKTQNQIILEIDSNYHITKYTVYSAVYSNYLSRTKESFTEMTLITSSTFSMKVSYNNKQEKPSNYMDHFKDAIEDN